MKNNVKKGTKNQAVIWLCGACSVLGLVAILCLIVLRPQEPPKALRFDCDYRLDMQIDPAAGTVRYGEQAIVCNLGAEETSELYFNLYANRELPKGEKINVVSVSAQDGDALSFQILNEGCLIRVHLLKPLLPGTNTTLCFQCEAVLSEMKATFGIARDGEIHLPSPHVQLAVYDEKGWDTAPVSENGDGRYSAVGDFSIQITAPTQYEVACIGKETGRENRGGTTVYQFEAFNRRDIMIALYTDYRMLERQVGNTTILGYFNENRVSETAAENAMDAAAFALSYYNDIYMEYPFDTLVLAGAAWATKTSLSMEYSGFVTVSMADNVDLLNVYHELAHQWFYFLVGNNEDEDAWLDEGFASFSANLCWAAAGDAEAAENWWDFYREIAGRYPGAKLNIPSDEMAGSYINLCYYRGAYFLRELMDTMGQEIFLEAVSDYCSRYLYRNASTEDFLNVLACHGEADISGILEEYLDVEIN